MLLFLFFNDSSTPRIYTVRHTLSPPHALPISWRRRYYRCRGPQPAWRRENLHIRFSTDEECARRTERAGALQAGGGRYDPARGGRASDRPRRSRNPADGGRCSEGAAHQGAVRRLRGHPPDDGRGTGAAEIALIRARSEEHTSELQSLMRISYAVFC